jgi:uncharacterized repeat protein (TIGR01451 family)
MISIPDSCVGRDSGPRLFPSFAGGGSGAIRIAAFGAVNAMQSRIASGFQRCFFDRSYIMCFKKLVLGLSLSMGALLVVTPAFAAGTAAGTTISNTASVAYDVGSVAQTPVTPATPADFVVDRRINVTVAESGGTATTVVPGASAQVLTFTVTNNSNATLDLDLAVTQDAGGGAPFGGTDSFDVVGPLVFVESGVTGGYQALQDTAIFIDELGPDQVRTVYIVSPIALTVTNGGVATLNLTAIAHQNTVALTGVYAPTVGSLAAPAAQTNTGAADNPTFIDTVFGDVAGRTDVARDGQHSAGDQYNVTTAAITVTKSSTVVSDPFNLLVNPKAIPGAVIEYCLDIENAGSATASSIVLTDTIPTNTTYVAGSIKVSATGTLAACDLNSGISDNDIAAGDGPTSGDHNVTTANAVTIRAPSITAGNRFKATFRVTVQ